MSMKHKVLIINRFKFNLKQFDGFIVQVLRRKRRQRRCDALLGVK